MDIGVQWIFSLLLNFISPFLKCSKLQNNSRNYLKYVFFSFLTFPDLWYCSHEGVNAWYLIQKCLILDTELLDNRARYGALCLCLDTSVTSPLWVGLKHSHRNNTEVRNNKANCKTDEHAWWWPHQSLQLLTLGVYKDSIQSTFASLAARWYWCCMQGLGWKRETEQSQCIFLSATFSVPGWQGCLSSIGNVYPRFQHDSAVRKVSPLSQTHLSSQSCFSRVLSPLPNSALLFWKSSVHISPPPPGFSSHFSVMQEKRELDLRSDICIRHRTRLNVYKRIHFVEARSFLGRQLSICLLAGKLFQGFQGWLAANGILSQEKQPPNKPWESWGLF